MSERSNFRAWLIWLGDPQPAIDPPAVALAEPVLANLVEMCARHGVLPTAVRHMRTLAQAGDAGRLIAATDGTSARAALEKIAMAASERLASVVGFAELLRSVECDVSAALRARGIDVMILKGTSFADRLYPDPALRPFTDIDLLVPKSQMEGAREALAGAGLRRAETHTQKHLGQYAEEKWVHPLLGAAPVELHWDLVGSPKVQKAISLTYGDLASLCDGDGSPGPYALLLVAAVHGAAGHGFERLQHVIDVAQAARGAAGAIDARSLSAAIRTGGVRLAVQAALLTAAGVLSDEPSAALALDMGGRAASALAHILGTATIAEAVGPYHARHSWRRQLYREALVRLALSAGAARRISHTQSPIRARAWPGQDRR